MAKTGYDFSGWATRSNIRCSDGRTIMPNAFGDCNGASVPLVWNHGHSDVDNVLGHAQLESRDGDIYAYGYLNGTEQAQHAKQMLLHGDIDSLSIYANHLSEDSRRNVKHGVIREVSLVLAGANPGALIDNVVEHGDGSSDAAYIYSDTVLEISGLTHADSADEADETKDSGNEGGQDETVGDVINSMTDKQKMVMFGIIGEAVKKAREETAGNDDSSEENSMKHNVFDVQDSNDDDALMHTAMDEIIQDGKRAGSLKESFLQHADQYGIKSIEYLFPDNKNLTNEPQFISRKMDWVPKVMGAVHHSPFSRIKSMFADITEDEARARGYMKGKLKKEEVFSLLKRTTDPCTIYKKQKLDRDDVIDITDFDVVAFIKSEMRTMLDEEIARALLVGDGRLTSSDDKIPEDKIRPVWKDEELYTINALIQDASGKAPTTPAETAQAFIRSAIKARKDYRGSGTPVLYTTEDLITECLLLTDTTGRDLYDSEEKLRTKLRVSDIVPVPAMEGLTREVSGKQRKLYGLIVNLKDYNIGADKGGAVNMFDDFDIDYNAQKYLIETRCSGALTVPKSAIALEVESAA